MTKSFLIQLTHHHFHWGSPKKEDLFAQLAHLSLLYGLSHEFHGG